jgi:hypothetical protein
MWILPDLGDVAIRWLNLYGYYYGRDRTFTRKFDQAIAQEGCGAEVTQEWLSAENIPHGHGDETENFSTATLDNVHPDRRIREGNWWRAMAGIDLRIAPLSTLIEGSVRAIGGEQWQVLICAQPLWGNNSWQTHLALSESASSARL